jgi:DNA-directed RNA polymerase subunit RPC12/RpoP
MSSKIKKRIVKSLREVDVESVANLLRCCNDTFLDRDVLVRQVVRFFFGDNIHNDDIDIIIGESGGDFEINITKDGLVEIVFEEEWPNTYRCRNCGSSKVTALAWVGINESNDIGIGDYYSDNIENPDDRHVQCDKCGHFGGVYGPGKGPDSGTYPAEF